MKNIIIIGTGRVGKTTLSNMVKEQFPTCNLIHSDSIKWGIIRGQGKEKYYDENVKAQKEWEHGEEFQKILLEIIKSMIRNDTKHYGTILETGQLEPKYAKELVDMGNTYCICLGHGDLTKQDIIDLCRTHDKETDWSYGISDNDLDAHANKWDEANQNLKKDCTKYGIEYIDTHENREEILKQILEKIKKECIEEEKSI